MHDSLNIVPIVASHLCVECGQCCAICPQQAIDLRVDSHGVYTPVVDEEHCTHCGLCKDTCPGTDIDFANLRTELPDRYHDVLGSFTGTYLGYAADQNIRAKGASGGLTTALLSHALKRGEITAVHVVTTECHPNTPPVTSHLVQATTDAELKAGQQSKYYTVPMNQCLQTILKAPPEHRFAFVGCGCHIQGLRKAQQRFPTLKNKIPLVLGIACGHCMDLRGTEHLLRLIGMHRAPLRNVSYRTGSWPGSFTAEDIHGTQRSIDHLQWTSYVLTVFERARCHVCVDLFAELADIVTGDPWIPELVQRYAGTGCNFAISRTRAGQALLEHARDAGDIQLEETPIETILKSQRKTIYRKRTLMGTSMRYARLRGHGIPSYKGITYDHTSSIKSYLNVLLLEFVRTVANMPVCKPLVTRAGTWYMWYREHRSTLRRAEHRSTSCDSSGTA